MCSAQTAALGEPMAGTANGAQRWILAEVNLPWPKPIRSHPETAQIDFEVLDRHSSRFLAIADSSSQEGASRRVIVYERGPSSVADPEAAASGTAGPMRGWQTQVDAAEVAHAVVAAARAELEMDPIDAGVNDVLVCTQGSHDRCCGKFGTLLYTQLQAIADDNTRFWRASHLGGHRFAPTAITFPDGLCWGAIDLEFVFGALSRSLAIETAVAHLRGSVAIDDPAAQFADVAAAARLGWDWLDSERSWTRTGDTVVFEGARTVTATVAPGPVLPVPTCGQPLDQARKTTQTRSLDHIGL